MRVLIVDDELPARQRLRRLLSAFADIDAIEEARDGEEALRLVAERAPDVVFLDVQMPGINGLDVAAALPVPSPSVVFVTAFEHYALGAFDAAAFDYLLKPVEPERLARCMQRLRERRAPAVINAPPAQLLIADRGRTHVVAVSDILWLEAADNYVVVHTADCAPLMRRTLASLLNDLGSGFIRVHRSAAVALAYVQQLQPRGKGDSLLVLRGGAAIACSRQYRAVLLECLENMR